MKETGPDTLAPDILLGKDMFEMPFLASDTAGLFE